MTDEIALTGLVCFGHHGVLDHERRDGQRFVVDVTLGVDTAPAAAADDLALTVDYGALATRVRDAVGADPVDLIETLAARIAAICLLPDHVEWVRVVVHKPDAPIDMTFGDVTVTLTRFASAPPPQHDLHRPITTTQEGRP